MKSTTLFALLFIPLTTTGCSEVPMFEWFLVAIAFATGWKVVDVIFAFIMRKMEDNSQ